MPTMATNETAPAATATALTGRQILRIKVVALTIFSLLLGAFYEHATRTTYRPDYVAGFTVALMHGAVMPAALPSLLLGRELPIYAPNNIGRGYNIGFILGLNACGTLFFGIGFWKPKKR